MEVEEEDKDKKDKCDRTKEKENEVLPKKIDVGNGGVGEDNAGGKGDGGGSVNLGNGNIIDTSGEQMSNALNSIARALTQMQEAMQSMQSKMTKTDMAIRGVARKLKVQGAVVKSIDRRVKVLELKASCPALSSSPSAVVTNISTPPLRGASKRTRPTFIVRSMTSTGHNTPLTSYKVLHNDSMTTLGKNLLKAAQNGRTKQVRELLDSGADINFTCGSEWTPLHRASAKAHDGVVGLLLERGANVKAKNGYGFTALHIAAYHDFSAQCVILLLEAGSDVNSKNRSGRTPLHYAAESGNMAAVRTLLAVGAKISAKDDEGRTPHSVAKTARVRRLLHSSPPDHNMRSFVHMSRFKLNRVPGAPLHA